MSERLQEADVSAYVVNEIIHDLADRGGLRQAWNEIDSDIRDEVIQTWREIVRRRIPCDHIEREDEQKH